MKIAAFSITLMMALGTSALPGFFVPESDKRPQSCVEMTFPNECPDKAPKKACMCPSKHLYEYNSSGGCDPPGRPMPNTLKGGGQRVRVGDVGGGACPTSRAEDA